MKIVQTFIVSELQKKISYNYKKSTSGLNVNVVNYTGSFISLPFIKNLELKKEESAFDYYGKLNPLIQVFFCLSLVSC